MQRALTTTQPEKLEGLTFAPLTHVIGGAEYSFAIPYVLANGKSFAVRPVEAEAQHKDKLSFSY